MKQDIRNYGVLVVDYKKGFTLLELLVSVAIFSIAIALVSYSFKYSLNIIKFINFSYAEDLQAFSKLRDSIDSLYFYMRQKEKNIVSSDDAFHFFFKGNEKEFMFVSAKPVIYKNRDLVLSKLTLEKNALFIEEYPIYDKDMDYKNPSFDWVQPKKLKILDNIKSIEISYIRDGQEKPIINDDIPEVIKLSVEYEKKEKEVYYFKIKSNAYYKKILGISVYEGI